MVYKISLTEVALADVVSSFRGFGCATQIKTQIGITGRCRGVSCARISATSCGAERDLEEARHEQ